MLDLACDIASDKADNALNVWEAVEKDIVGHSTVKWMAQVGVGPRHRVPSLCPIFLCVMTQLLSI